MSHLIEDYPIKLESIAFTQLTFTCEHQHKNELRDGKLRNLLLKERKKMSITNRHPKAKNHGPELCSFICNYHPILSWSPHVYVNVCARHYLTKKFININIKTKREHKTSFKYSWYQQKNEMRTQGISFLISTELARFLC